MATPASAQSPTQESQGRLHDHNEKSLGNVQYPESQSREESFSQDPEKAIDSLPPSTHTGEATLSGDAPADAEQDPNIVDWDGPDDPKNPLNWTAMKKWGIIWSISAITLISPIGSSFFAPGVPQVMRAFHETSLTISAFVVSVYLLGFAIGPLVIAPMSELYGRRMLYNITNVLFIVFNIACAVSNSMGMLIAFRFLAGCAGSAPLTLGGGSIADMFPREQRAGATIIWAIGPLIGPVIGPIGGGFLVEKLVWRWVFWIIAMFAGLFAVIFFFVGEESYPPVILARKAEALRKETGNMELRSKLASGLPPKEIFTRAIVRPMKMLVRSPIVFLMSLYVAINYGILYLFFTTVTFVFEGQYHFSSGAVGLSYIGVGVGMVVGMILLSLYSDQNIVKHQKLGGAKPEHRLMLRLTVPSAVSLPIGVFIYGWTTYHKVHWIVPIISASTIGLGNLMVLMTIQTYLIDAFTIHAASALAANTILRSAFGAFLPLAGRQMYNKLGLGWGNSVLGFLALAVIPVPILFRAYGERIRTSPRWQVQF